MEQTTVSIETFMRKHIVACIFLVLFIVSGVGSPVKAYSTMHIISNLTISAGGSGYSDTLIIPNDPTGNSTSFVAYHISLESFHFELYPQNVKPNSNVRFNFRLVTNASTNCGEAIHLYDANTSVTASIFTDCGNSGDSVKIKGNVSNYSSTGCNMVIEWYLNTI